MVKSRRLFLVCQPPLPPWTSHHCRACTIVTLHHTGVLGGEKHFHVSRMLQWCRKFMKMLFCELFLTLARWRTTPRIHCNGLWDRSADPSQEAGRGVRTHCDYECLLLSLVFAEGLRSRCWKRGTINDLHHFAFNKLRQTTSSVPQVPRLTRFPGFHLCCAFEPGLKAAIETDIALRKPDSRQNGL